MNISSRWCPTFFQSYPNALIVLVSESEPRNQAAASNPTASRILWAVYRRTDRAETPAVSLSPASLITSPSLTVTAWAPAVGLDLLAHCQQLFLSTSGRICRNWRIICCPHSHNGFCRPPIHTRLFGTSRSLLPDLGYL